MATNNLPSNQSLGFMSCNFTAGLTALLNSANTWLAVSFMGNGKTLDSFMFYVSSITGTQANVGYTVSLYSSGGSLGYPGTELAIITVTIGNCPAAGWHTVSGFNYALTDGTHYWIVIKNISVAPATDYPRIQTTAAEFTAINVAGNSTSYARITTTNGGTSWSATQGVCGWRIGFSDSTYMGIAVAPINTNPSALQVYGTREAGVKFTTPPNAKLVIAGLCLRFYLVSSPGTATLSLRYGGSVYTAIAIPQANIISSIHTIYTAYFATPVTINPDSEVRLTLKASGGDVSNIFQLGDATLENSAATKSVIPYGVVRTTTTDNTANPIVWTDTDTSLVNFLLILNTDSEFAASGGGEHSYMF